MKKLLGLVGLMSVCACESYAALDTNVTGAISDVSTDFSESAGLIITAGMVVFTLIFGVRVAKRLFKTSAK
jgi:Na+/proline symporter